MVCAFVDGGRVEGEGWKEKAAEPKGGRKTTLLLRASRSGSSSSCRHACRFDDKRAAAAAWPAPQVGLVSFFLPFFPLERRHVRQLFEMRLGERRDELAAQGLGGLRWGPEVIEFLASRVGGGATASVCVSGRLFGWGQGG